MLEVRHIELQGEDLSVAYDLKYKKLGEQQAHARLKRRYLLYST